MLALAMIALFAVTAPVQEQIQELDSQEELALLLEEEQENEELALNEEGQTEEELLLLEEEAEELSFDEEE